jgi:hypothetical protein
VKKKAKLLLVAGFTALVFSSVYAATVLADLEDAEALSKTAPVEPSGACTMVDFEMPDEKVAYAAMPFRRPRMAIVSDFAASGEKAFRVSWDARHRMGFTIKIPQTDFAPYDRLVIDVVNAGPEPDQLNLHVAAAAEKLDDSIYRVEGLRGSLYAPLGRSTWVVELERWPKKAQVSRTKVSDLRFYALHPYGTTMYLDNIRLLKKGEALVPGTYRPEDAAKISALVKGVEESNHVTRAASKTALKEAMAAAGMTSGRMLVGTATSMEHVLPKDPAALAQVRPAAALRLRLARGEFESAQIIVAPQTGTLCRVSVACSDLVCRDGHNAGATLAASNVTCAVTGYSRTQYQAPYAVGRTVFTNTADSIDYLRRGHSFPRPDWYPDVILDHVRETDVAEDTAQSFWVRVRCPRDQAAGVYRGELTVSAQGIDPLQIPFTVRVNDFTLPKTAALPVAMNFNPSGSLGWLPTNAEHAERQAAKNDPLAPQNIWRKRRMEWVDFLADYLIPYDFLYRVRTATHDREPNWDALLRLKEQGRLAPFTLAYWGQTPEGEKGRKKWEELLPYYRGIYDKAKELGLIDMGFFYGNDECNPKEFPAIRRAADLFHKEFPGVPLFTTSRDVDYGIGTNSLENVEWFCPLTGRYDLERAEKARAAGRKVWWYVCDGPTWKYANLHIENKPIDVRSLMGAQSVLFKTDGFLYWQLAKWLSPRTIGTDPFTDWVAASCFGFNGEGCMTAAGPDGIPLPTVRLENFRDGLEDYAYVTLLKEKIQARGKEDEWTRRARELVAVPPTVVKALDCFNDDPAALTAWRDAMADLLE